MAPIKKRLISLVRKSTPLHQTIWRARQGYHWCNRWLRDGRSSADGAPLLERALIESQPFAIGKMGSVEAAGVKHYLGRRAALHKDTIPRRYPPYVRETLFMNAGVFPPDDQVFDRFGDIYLDAVGHCDALVAWNVAGEAEIFSQFCRRATLIDLRCLEPYHYAKPWTRLLAGKKVLVISPFAQTIEQQYRRREALWDNTDMLPEFDLRTVRAPLSAGLVAPESRDWFEALEKMTLAMGCASFDVVLVGAGAYSLPLVARAKQHHKVCIHLGGVLQIMFGILGSRWERRSSFTRFIKSSWCRPNAQETPKDIQRVELGCYW